MKLAIHTPDYPNSFSHKWIEYCNIKNIDFIIVDCFDTNIITILKESNITHLLWHFGQVWRDLLTARNVLFAAEMMGIKVFPDKYTSWHFDDKISQKYLLEAMGIDFVNSFVFYNRDCADNYISSINKFPLVAKLRRGSGSTSVTLIKSSRQLKKYSNGMFLKGKSPSSNISFDFSKRINSIKKFNDFKIVIKKIVTRLNNNLLGIQAYPKELGYLYFQEFIPNNNFDIRIIVIGKRAYGIKRMVRKNDFRASGSGNIIYNVSQINFNCVIKAFEVANKLKTQCIGIDFVFDKENNPLVVEISYGFAPRAYDKCEGYWDNEFAFHKGSNILEYNIMEDFLSQ